MITIIPTLKERYEIFKMENPKVRIRDAANQLNVTEAELVATGIGETVIRLGGNFQELLKDCSTLGYVMALTRNHSAVHERKGEYKNVSFNGHVGLVLGEGIDLRLFMTHWKYGFAVHENDRRSLQFFAGDGEAVHKIYLTDHSNGEAYQALVAKYQATNQLDDLALEASPDPVVETPDSDVDEKTFRQSWLDLKDTHDFFGMLQKHNVSRVQAMRLAPDGYAQQTNMEAVRNVFHRVSETGLPIMIFVGSRGCIQIHTGDVKKLVSMGPWFNVMDPAFNLHLREDQITAAWVVKKPTADGIVTSLELFDAVGNPIALIFGERKPGVPEKEEWRDVVAHIALAVN